MKYCVYRWLRGSGRVELAKEFDNAVDAAAYIIENNDDEANMWIYGMSDPEEED